MAGMYRPRHPERAALYRVLFHYFDRFLTEYESRFEKEYGFFRPIVRGQVTVRYHGLYGNAYRGKVKKVGPR